jgi:hypothetical protein
MTQANFGGLAGAAIGGAVGYGMGRFLGTMGLTQMDAVAGGAIAGCFSASMFGLLYDRSVVPEFRKSYKTLTRHLAAAERSGPDYDPRERLAFFGIPVAFATFIVPIVAAILWVALRKEHEHFAAYVVAGILSVAATMIVGGMTAEHRLLEREIAFNTTPTVDQAPPQQHQHAPEPQAVRYPRLHAVICVFGGFLLLGMNHMSAVYNHTYYQKAVFGGPMITMVGLFALFEPRIMSRHLPIGKTYPKTVLLLTHVAMVIGGAAGWQLDAWYHG